MLDAPKPSPRLTRLELQGFKSFANRTVFVFEPGITAIIGPNGSGKSNISDAVRWVLGEQSHNLLRSKKTEDVIFAGGQGKAPMGLAEVSVTFDNSTGWLPIAFSEVTVTRRATRGGENQFLINGKKVRMKDVQHLTASLGHSYMVVGQGMVDAALSQRAEDRRGLFEHAADIAGLRMKASEAERNLADAESNAARINDLLTETEPRLRSMERAAKQAREWQGVHDRLRTLQQAHYRNLLQHALQQLEGTESGAHAGEDAVEAGRIKVEQLVAAIAANRLELEQSRDQLSQHLVRLQTGTEQARRISHEQDLTRERLTALQRRRDDMTDTELAVENQTVVVLRDLAKIDEDLAWDEITLQKAQLELATFEAGAASVRTRRAELDRRSSALFATASNLERRIADVARRRALLFQKRESETAEGARGLQSRAERHKRIAHLASELDTFERDETNGAIALTNLDERLDAMLRDVESAAHAEQAARAALVEIDRRVTAAQARLDALLNIQASGAGLFAGPKAVIQAGKAGRLHGIRGALAELIEVPARYETALEVALGGRLQDIVVDRWVDAEAAIALLKADRSGRATFQPIDSVRGNRASLPGELADASGVEGIAADLISTPPDTEAIIHALLSRTLVVTDLPVARRILPSLPGGWSAVTLSGEISRSGGSVTGGAAVKESGTLARERELRELPEQIGLFESERQVAVAAQEEAAAMVRTLAAERLALDSERASITATRRERATQHKRLGSWLDDLKREQQAADTRSQALSQAQEAIGTEIAQLEAEASALEGERNDLDTERTAISAAIASQAQESGEAEEAVSVAGRSVAALEERLRAERRRQASLAAQRTALGQEKQVRAERAAALKGEITALGDQQQRLESETSLITVTIAALTEAHQPMERTVRDDEQTLARHETNLETAHEELLEAERNRGQSGLSVERARSEVATIRQRIEDDLELDDPDEILDNDAELDVAREEAEREIYRLKERLRRVGYVGEEAVEEYQREAERYTFLRTQLEDVFGTSERLRHLLAGLHATMQAQFEETFTKVAAAFSQRFTTLFGGGFAKLVIVEGENGESAGVDIVAQPPGKRLQSLALLSGGERALTAAALLFAILEVNPSPFALLDEVDAALDEANIVRFREQLQALAAESQAIIITHNRGTIEVADTLYGVSMREDGVSTVLSIRMAETAAVG